MTPFELALENVLHIEVQRFHDQWLFKWYGMTHKGGKTDVEDFRGGRISYAGNVFGEQQQQIYWQAVDRYLMLKIHEIFQQWEAETKSYPAKARFASLTGVERTVSQFVTTVIQRALGTAQRLRNVGGTIVATHGTASRPGAEVVRLADAHRALLKEDIKKEATSGHDGKPVWNWGEKFYANNKGLIW